MSDADVVKGEEARLRRERQSKLAKCIWRQWTAEGYNQHAHMHAVQHEGDAAILRNWCASESHPQRVAIVRGKEILVPKDVELTHWMAHRDMAELWSDYTSKTFSGRVRQTELEGANHG